eukprot:8669411-Pyramimonas_sp.AAC.1
MGRSTCAAYGGDQETHGKTRRCQGDTLALAMTPSPDHHHPLGRPRLGRDARISGAPDSPGS